MLICPVLSRLVFWDDKLLKRGGGEQTRLTSSNMTGLMINGCLRGGEKERLPRLPTTSYSLPEHNSSFWSNKMDNYVPTTIVQISIWSLNTLRLVIKILSLLWEGNCSNVYDWQTDRAQDATFRKFCFHKNGLMALMMLLHLLKPISGHSNRWQNG